MKNLLNKLCITSGLLITTSGFSQTMLEADDLLQETEALQYSKSEGNWSKGKGDIDLGNNKIYGNGNYSVIYNASSASAVDQGAESVYGNAGCIYQPAGTVGLARYDIPLQIPTGHEVLGMRYAFNDNSAGTTTAIIYSVDASGAFATEHTVTSSGDTGYASTYVSMTEALPIDNLTHKYGIRFWSSEAGSDQKMCALRIEINSTP